MSMTLDDVAKRVAANRSEGSIEFYALPDDMYLYVRFGAGYPDRSCDLVCSGDPISVGVAARCLDLDTQLGRDVTSLCVPLSEVYSGSVSDDMTTGGRAVWDRLIGSGGIRAVARYALLELERWAFSRLRRYAEMPSRNSVEARLQYAEATAAFLSATSHDDHPVSTRQAKSTTPPEGLPVWKIPEPALPAQLAVSETEPAGTGLTAELDTIRFKSEDKKKHRGKGILVAVLDTGTTPSHPAFRGLSLKAVDATGTNPSGRDSNGHGTGCCGIVAGRVGDGYPNEYEGVAPDCGLLSVQVLTAGGWGTDDMIARGVQIARAAEADVISMSLGGPSTMPKTEKQLEGAAKDGIVIVAAAGNDGPGMGTVGYPGRYDPVQCVGATGNGDSPTVASFSSRGQEVDLMGPGVNVLMPHPNGGWWRGSGTSMATPFVAGSLAVCLSAESGDAGDDTTGPAKVLPVVRKHCRRIQTPGTGAGIIDVSATLEELVGTHVPPPPPPPPPPTSFNFDADPEMIAGIAKGAEFGKALADALSKGCVVTFTPKR